MKQSFTAFCFQKDTKMEQWLLEDADFRIKNCWTYSWSKEESDCWNIKLTFLLFADLILE